MTRLIFASILLIAAALPACAIVPAYRREAFADAAMDPTSDALERRSMRRMHTSREGSSGGDGVAAGGGCGCGN